MDGRKDMRFPVSGFGLYAELMRADAYARDDFLAIENCIDRIESGLDIPHAGLHAHQYAMMALNCHNGIICGPIEMMKYEFPGTSEEPMLNSIRCWLVRVKQIALRVLHLLGVDNAQQEMRHYSCKFRELFTTGWLEGRHYTQQQLERILNAAMRCARAFLLFLASQLKRLEETFVVDDMRPIAIGAHVAPFVLLCHRSEGVVVLRQNDRQLKTMEISPHAKQAWRVIRAAVSTRAPDGIVQLPTNALALFRNTDGENALKENGLSEFARYLHSAGQPGAYRLLPYQKRRNAH